MFWCQGREMLTDRRGRTGATDHTQTDSRDWKKDTRQFLIHLRCNRQKGCVKPCLFGPFSLLILHWDEDLNYQNGGRRLSLEQKTNWMIRLRDKGLFIRKIYKIGRKHRERPSNAAQSTVFCTFAEFKPLNASRGTRPIRRFPQASAHEHQETSLLR